MLKKMNQQPLWTILLICLCQWAADVDLGCCSPETGTFCETKRFSSGSLITKYNSNLNGSVVMSFETPGLIACSHKCLRFSWCISINYNVTAEREGDCQLNNKGLASQIENFTTLTRKQGFVFSQLRPEKVSHYSLYM